MPKDNPWNHFVEDEGTAPSRACLQGMPPAFWIPRWCWATSRPALGRACVRLPSGRQESNLRKPGSKPGGRPLTHALKNWGDRRGLNPHLRVHSAPCRATTPRPPLRCPGWIRTNIRTASKAVVRPLDFRASSFEGQGSNLHWPGQSRRACQLADPRVEAKGIEPSSTGYRPIALPLSYASKIPSVRGTGVEPVSAACKTAAQPIDQPRGRGERDRTSVVTLPKRVPDH